MTFTSLLLALACSCLCLEASRAFAAGPAAYTTITNRIDIMGAVESAQENNAGGYRGQNIYSAHEEPKIMSNSKIIPDADLGLTYPDALNASKTSHPVNLQRFISASGTPAIVTFAGPSFSYVATSSGPSISISSAGPNVHTISYSAPGRIFVSHGSPGSSYVLSTYPPSHIQTRKPLFSSSGENFENRNSASEAKSFAAYDETTKMSGPFSSSSSSYGLQDDHSAVAAFRITDSRLPILSIIDLVAAGPSATAGIVYGNGHQAYTAAYRNLQAARQVVHGISSAVTRAVNANLAGIGAAQL